MKQWSKAKITVLEKHVMKNLVEEFITDDRKEKGFGICDAFKQGQEFILEAGPHKPEGFCSWAWADIHKDLIAIMAGANFPWIKQDGVAVACCTDAIRPVIFKIERI